MWTPVVTVKALLGEITPNKVPGLLYGWEPLQGCGFDTMGWAILAAIGLNV